MKHRKQKGILPRTRAAEDSIDKTFSKSSTSAAAALSQTTLERTVFNPISSSSLFDSVPGGMIAAAGSMAQSTTTTTASDEQGRRSKRKKKNMVVNSNKTYMFVSLIMLLGLGIAAAFCTYGYIGAVEDQALRFELQASELVSAIESSWRVYDISAAWIQQTCRRQNNKQHHDLLGNQSICSREDFRDLYYSLVDRGLEFGAIQYIPQVQHYERLAFEQEARDYFDSNYPGQMNYTGFVGFENGGTHLQSRSEQPFYFPVHYLYPVLENQQAAGFDMYSSTVRRATVETVLLTWKPALTEPLILVQDAARDDVSGLSVLLLHPGRSRVREEGQSQPTSFAVVILRIADLLRRATAGQSESISVYLYDKQSSWESAAASTVTGPPTFLGGAHVYVKHPTLEGAGKQLDLHIISDPVDLATLQQQHRFVQHTPIQMAQRTWIVAVVPQPGTFRPELAYVLVGGVLIFVACFGFALWLCTSLRRANQVTRVKQQAQTEKARLIIEAARQAAIAERELNDYIAHEVRNPLASAMSACTFVQSALDYNNNNSSLHEQQRSLLVDDWNDDSELGGDQSALTTAAAPPPLPDSARKAALEDVCIIGSSLQFINDLLRSMLDMHRASNGQLTLNSTPTDVLRDVLEPVATMLHRRGDGVRVEVQVDPPNLVVVTDRMRLKQIVLNLSNNSRKFVHQGFIRLRAQAKAEMILEPTTGSPSASRKQVTQEYIELSVEDSGPGIPLHKRTQLFSKFQESLDSLNQGTGIGLCLSKRLATLLNGSLSLDETYDSGVEGCPGTRFVITLNIPPRRLSSLAELQDYDYDESSSDVLKGGGASSVVSLDEFAASLDGSGRGRSLFGNMPLYGDSAEEDILFVKDESAPEASKGSAPPESARANGGIKESGTSAVATATAAAQPQLATLLEDKSHHETATTATSGTNMSSDSNSSAESNAKLIAPPPSPTKKRPRRSSSDKLVQLPESLTVLVVDDDLILRKLITRSLKRVAPSWKISEAANGETALRMVGNNESEGGGRSNKFDIILLDQYMASVEKQLLGTETVVALRAKGVTSKICGLSANNLKDMFFNAGADSFMLKPFPCDKEQLTVELHRVLCGNQRQEYQQQQELNQQQAGSNLLLSQTNGATSGSGELLPPV